ncbi:hypothetical protein LTR84_010455 [Exophiala bonariae]|uniref:Nucleoside phosphorylase domain-containing protein n=1 Tax=Exophiala bonariae TaxID=1690606 RepID=A0AAV9MT37_9EURO|nr:hypothetical protein LTR84_010455 [Exophiala bonariae]
MAASLYPRPVNRSAFEIAILCALSIESDAVEALFDQFWEEDDVQYGKVPGDPNSYTLGRIGRHNVVLAYMPAMGKISSATVAASFRASFAHVRLGLVVGICGGVPRLAGHVEDIFLGDVIISTGIVQFDFGRQFTDRMIRKDTLQDSLGRPNHEIRAFLKKLQGWRARSELRRHISEYVHEVCDKEWFGPWATPGPDEDTLYRADYRHKHQDPIECEICARCLSAEDPVCNAALESSCAQLDCDQRYLVLRQRPPNSGPTVHFGLVASGDVVVKSGLYRDRIAAEEKVIGFEMEGAGVWDSFPTVVIKSVCDYGDSHKNKIWQRHCAIVAAAAAKGFLRQWRGADIPISPPPEANQDILPRSSDSRTWHMTYGGSAYIMLRLDAQRHSESPSGEVSQGHFQTYPAPDNPWFQTTPTPPTIGELPFHTKPGHGNKANPEQAWIGGASDRSAEIRGQASSFAKVRDYNHAITTKVENIILQKLAFRGMGDREQDIKDNYPETFQWIFKEPSHDDSLEGTNFINWLRHGAGCYWINGKAASGKSTLMKFIIKQKETKEALKIWTGGDRLHSSSFFFWHLGNRLQKSQAGLLRSILFSALDATRPLIRKVFPDYFTELAEYETIAARNNGQAPLGVPVPGDLTDQEYRRAFHKILQAMPEGCKICFFIDGIDEYEGNCYEISELLKKSCGPRVKMVLSSRPIPPCAMVFKGCAGLRLQDLTRPDIELYINSIIWKHSRMKHLIKVEPVRAARLVTELVNRASGVFLWVVLVTTNLMSGLNNFDTMDDLEARLDYFPRELEKLYQHIMEQVEPLYRRKAFELLQIALRGLDTDADLTVLKLSFADEEDPTTVLRPNWRAPDNVVLKLRMEEMEARMSSRTRGLLESAKSSEMSDPFLGPGPRVRFLHKSVADYLRQPQVLDFLTGFTSATSFNTSVSLLSSTLHMAKIFENDLLNRGWQPALNIATNQSRQHIIHVIVREAQEADHAGFDISEYINEFSRWEGETGGYGRWFGSFPHPLPLEPPSTAKPSNLRREIFLRAWYGLANSTITYLAAQPQGTINEECPDILWSTASKLRLQTCSNNVELQGMLSTIEVLLRHGSNPNFVVNGQTAWGNLLVQILDWDISSKKSISKYWTLLEVYFQLIVIMLKSGADPHIVIVGEVVMKDASILLGDDSAAFTSERSVAAWIDDRQAYFSNSATVPQWAMDTISHCCREASSMLVDSKAYPWRKSSSAHEPFDEMLPETIYASLPPRLEKRPRSSVMRLFRRTPKEKQRTSAGVTTPVVENPKESFERQSSPSTPEAPLIVDYNSAKRVHLPKKILL